MSATAAEWLPGRFRLPLFRLIGLCVAFARRPVHAPPGIILMRDRDQSALENFSMSTLLYLMHSIGCFVLLRSVSGPLIASVGGVLLATISMQLVTVLISMAVGPFDLPAGTSNQVQNVLHHLALFAFSVWLVRQPITLLRATGAAWLLFLGLNLLCAVVLLGFSRKIAALEKGVWPGD